MFPSLAVRLCVSLCLSPPRFFLFLRPSSLLPVRLAILSFQLVRFMVRFDILSEHRPQIRGFLVQTSISLPLWAFHELALRSAHCAVTRTQEAAHLCAPGSLLLPPYSSNIPTPTHPTPSLPRLPSAHAPASKYILHLCSLNPSCSSSRTPAPKSFLYLHLYALNPAPSPLHVPNSQVLPLPTPSLLLLHPYSLMPPPLLQQPHSYASPPP